MILIDTAEPLDITELLKQSADTQKLPLNQQDMADYYLAGLADSRTRQFCRVQTGELLSNIDSQEQELRKYYNSADENSLIIEGIISTFPIGKRQKSLDAITIRQASHPSRLFSYSVTDKGHIYNEHCYDVGMAYLAAWLFRLEQCGISHYHTLNLIETAKLIASIHKNCMKPPEEHGTLNRYIKPRISIKPYNKHAVTLMGVADARLGETRALAMAEYFGTAIAAMTASVEDLCEVPGIGKTVAEKFIKALGREE